MALQPFNLTEVQRMVVGLVTKPLNVIWKKKMVEHISGSKNHNE
jgi:hypothetical protein